MRTMIPGATYRVVLKSLPADEAGLRGIAEALARRDHPADQVARLMGSLPSVVATHLTHDQALVLVRELGDLGASADLVDAGGGPASLDPARARVERARTRATRRSRGMLLILGGAAALAAWVLAPDTARLRFAPEAGETMRFEQLLDLEQQLDRGPEQVAAKGTWQWTLERTVLSADREAVVVRDRFLGPTSNLRVVGASESGYRDQVRRLESALASTPIEDRLVSTGRTEKRGDDSALRALTPYPGVFRIIFQKLYFPPDGIEEGDEWVTPLSDVHSIGHRLVGFEERFGRSCAHVVFESGRTYEPVRDDTSSAATQERTDVKGEAYFDTDTGWLLEASLEIDYHFTTVAGLESHQEMQIEAHHRWIPAGASAGDGAAAGDG